MKVLDKLAHEVSRAEVDLRCGLHSGIPRCCIAWFVSCWRFWPGARFNTYYKIVQLSEELHGIAFDHIPCPLCIVRGREDGVLDCACVAEWRGETLEALEPFQGPWGKSPSWLAIDD